MLEVSNRKQKGPDMISGPFRLLKNPLNFEGGSLFLISHG